MDLTEPSRRPRRLLTLTACFLAAGAVTAAGAGFATTFASANPDPVVVTPPVPEPSVPAAPTTSTTQPVESRAPVEPADPTLRPGDQGPAVADLQARLSELGYWLGEADGRYGLTTAQAVLAFQKAEGLTRDAVASGPVLARLEAAARPEGRSAPGSGDVVEIDLTRQLLLIIRDGETLHALNTSTGTSSTPTPPGTYAVNRQIDGIRRAPLGNLYRPKYFHEGYAVHGSPSIPGWPASHGCARLSNAAMDMLWAEDLLPKGTPVWVYR